MKFRVWLAGKIVCPKLRFSYFHDGGTYYNNETEEVTLGANAWEDECGFLRNLREVHGCKEWNKVSVATWSLLHEIGHYHTFNYFTEDDLQVRALCALVPLSMAENSVELQDMYFGIGTEWEATEWAIDWVQNNPWRSRLVNKLLRKGV